MSEKKFKVTLLGIAEGFKREETEAKLAAIFKKKPNQIRTLLDKRVVIGNNLAHDKAIKYKQALKKAGALHKIEAIKPDLPPPSLPSEPKTYCRNCGSEVAEQAVMCLKCGVPPKNGTKFCQNCGKTSNPNAEICVKCGVKLATGSNTKVAKGSGEGKDYLTTLLLFIPLILGIGGIHRFYTGYIGIGIAQLLTLGGCGIWAIIDFILIVTEKFKDADGNELVKK